MHSNTQKKKKEKKNYIWSNSHENINKPLMELPSNQVDMEFNWLDSKTD